MSNRVAVTIDNRVYHVLSAEDESYVRRVAAYVEEQVKGAMKEKTSAVDGATLAAMNITDQLFREREISENLRRQLKEHLEEGARRELELSQLKREVFRLQNRK